ncbi:hypothetical protein K0U83_03055 [bacterium]|nr:hypothetical protein [bacterium]
MPGTQITQHRTPVLTDSGTVYQISATCTAAGTLPDVYVFVKQVVNFDDPKDDTHYRVAAPADFDALLIDREDAIEAGPGSEGAYLYRDAGSPRATRRSRRLRARGQSFRHASTTSSRATTSTSRCS